MIISLRTLIFSPIFASLIFTSPPIASAQDAEWPYNLPPHVKYYPEDEALVKRNIDIQQRLHTQTPMGVRKMSGEPGEKFYFDYWSFESDENPRQFDATGNISSCQAFAPPLMPHKDILTTSHILPRYLRFSLPHRSVYEKRDFICPTDSEACTSINRPDSCCAVGSTCQLIQDTGLGDVGCCDAGETCAGTLSSCPAGGYTSCPNNPGGGCCLPGYACLDVGCVLTVTATLLVAPTPSTISTTTVVSTSTVTPPLTVTETLTTVVVPPVTSSSVSSPSTVPSTVTSPSTATSSASPSSSPGATTTTEIIVTTSQSTSTLPNTLVCSTGYRSCPVSLGGGCCPTDRACGRDVCPEMSSTNSVSAPIRPTTETSRTTVTKTSSSSSSTSIIGCPTGFYACSAYYQGGCCQVGRDCGMTSCPASASTTVVNTNGVTAVAPTGSGITGAASLLTGTCATGWSTCAPSVGGGCCPSGYACGTACTATATGGGGSQVGKIAPNDAKTTMGSVGLVVLFSVPFFSVVLGFIL